MHGPPEAMHSWVHACRYAQWGTSCDTAHCMSHLWWNTGVGRSSAWVGWVITVPCLWSSIKTPPVLKEPISLVIERHLSALLIYHVVIILFILPLASPLHLVTCPLPVVKCWMWKQSWRSDPLAGAYHLNSKLQTPNPNPNPNSRPGLPLKQCITMTSSVTSNLNMNILWMWVMVAVRKELEWVVKYPCNSLYFFDGRVQVGAAFSGSTWHQERNFS